MSVVFYLFLQFFLVRFMFVLPVLLLMAIICLPKHFWYILRVFISIYRCYLQCWRILFRPHFSTHSDCLCHLVDVRPYASSWEFLLIDSFVEILSSITLRMVPSIFPGGQHRGLSYCGDFYLIVFFSNIFLVLLRYSSLMLFHLYLFDSVRFQ